MQLLFIIATVPHYSFHFAFTVIYMNDVYGTDYCSSFSPHILFIQFVGYSLFIFRAICCTGTHTSCVNAYMCLPKELFESPYLPEQMVLGKKASGFIPKFLVKRYFRL